jgi:hypothetical protein
MKTFSLFVLCFLSSSLAMAPPGQAPEPSSSSLAALMPAGSLLYIEAPDFAALVHDWNGSKEKQSWLKSDNYQVFSRSRLFLRLQEAQGQFAVAAGAPPNMPLLESLAGRESALAIYDIGNLEFLYITRLPSARAVENVLWSGREKFEPRKAADIPYYVRTEPEKNRLVAFAISGDYLLLATREDLMAGALSSLSGKSHFGLEAENWYKSAVGAAGPRGDLRLVLNLPLLAKSPHFRSYWIERNVAALKQYSAEVSDLHRSAAEIREDRVLLKANPPQDTAAGAAGHAITELLGMVPPQQGIYLAWKDPSSDQVLDLLRQKILMPRAGPGVASLIAPGAVLNPSQAGSESDLETRIDVAPLQGAGGALDVDALKRLLDAAPLQAVLEFHSLQQAGQPAFIDPHSALLIRSSADWDSQAARAALRTAIRELWTTSQIGVNWVEQREGNVDYYELEGLVPLAVAAHGPVLLVANSAEMLRSLLGRAPLVPRANSQSAEAGGSVVYAAGFGHSAERENIVQMMRLVEMPLPSENAGLADEQGREPAFFSGNLASLSQSLESIESESLVVEDRGPLLVQTVTYRLAQK